MRKQKMQNIRVWLPLSSRRHLMKDSKTYEILKLVLLNLEELVNKNFRFRSINRTIDNSFFQRFQR